METTQIVSENHSGDKEESDYDTDTDTTDTSTIQLPSQFRYNFKEMLQQQQQYEDDDGMDHVVLSEPTSATTTTTLPIRYVLPNQQSILNYEQFLSSLLHNSNDRNKSESSGCYDDLKHVDDHYIDYGYCGGVVMDRTVEKGHDDDDDDDDIVDSGTRVEDVGIDCNGMTVVYYNQDQIQHCPNHPSPLMVQQNKHIPGKGGFCWDAAFILSEYMIHQITIQQPQELDHETSFPSISTPAIPNSDPINTPDNTVRMLELGCGTGICGMYIAKHLSLLHHSNYCDSHSLRQRQPQKNYQIIITDMDGPIQSLIQDNLRKNFHYYTKDEMEQFSEYFAKHQYPPVFENDAEGSKEKQPHHATTGTATISYNDNSHPTTLITAMVLDWDDYYHATTTAATTTTTETTTYDVVFGSDIVASIYDPIKLAYTIYYLCHAQSVVYISYKERLSTIHALFQTTLTQLFECVRIFNTCTGTKIFDTMDSCSGTTTNTSASEKDRDQQWHHFTSRNGNPNVYIIVASHRKLHAPLHPIDDEGDSNS